MGFFEVFCGESDLVLGGDTRLILVTEAAEKRFEPIALPLAGSYNRYGSIDAPQSLDANAAAIDAFCRGLTFDSSPSKPDFDHRLMAMNHGVSEDSWARWKDRKISFALVYGPVYDAIVETVAGGGKQEWATMAHSALDSRPFEELFARAFPLTDLSLSIYAPLDAPREAALKPALAEFVRFRAWGTALLPVNVEEGGQCCGYADRGDDLYAERFVEAAKKKYAGFPRILAALEANKLYWQD